MSILSATPKRDRQYPSDESWSDIHAGKKQYCSTILSVALVSFDVFTVSPMKGAVTTRYGTTHRARSRSRKEKQQQKQRGVKMFDNGHPFPFIIMVFRFYELSVKDPPPPRLSD